VWTLLAMVTGLVSPSSIDLAFADLCGQARWLIEARHDKS